MWPLFRPGRGSGASPRKRSAGRASTTCAEPVASASRTSSSEATKLSSSRGVKSAAASGALRRVSSGRPSLRPFRQAAFEDADLLDAIGAQRPPDARRGEQAERVVDDEAHAVAETERAHLLRQRLGLRQHVRQALVEDRRSCRCRRTPRPEYGPAGTRQRPSRPVGGRCHDASITPEVRVAEFGGEFICGAEVARRHRAPLRSGRERDAHAPVEPALLLDLRHRRAADFAGARDMRAAAGLEVEAVDRDEAHAARFPSAA